MKLIYSCLAWSEVWEKGRQLLIALSSLPVLTIIIKPLLGRFACFVVISSRLSSLLNVSFLERYQEKGLVLENETNAIIQPITSDTSPNWVVVDSSSPSFVVAAGRSPSSMWFSLSVVSRIYWVTVRLVSHDPRFRCRSPLAEINTPLESAWSTKLKFVTFDPSRDQLDELE